MKDAHPSPLGLGAQAKQSLRRLARLSGLGTIASRLRPAALQRLLTLRGALHLSSAESKQSTTGTEQPGTPTQSSDSGRDHNPSIPSAAPCTPTSSWVTLEAKDAYWLLANWELSSSDQHRARALGGQQLTLRLMEDHSAQAQAGVAPAAMARLEVVVDGACQQWLLPVPLSGRRYRLELGYRLVHGGWLALAGSDSAPVPASACPLQDEPVPSIVFQAIEATSSASIPAAGVEHERLYQLASGGQRRTRSSGSEQWHEQGRDRRASQDQSRDEHASGAGLWESGLSASGLGLSGAGLGPRARSFWLVADAMLIVHGATEHSAQLRVADQPMPLDQQGCFRVDVPFPDGEQHYPIHATAADGEQQRSLRLDFRRETTQARLNRLETAALEWF